MGNTATGRERYEAYGKVTRDGVIKKVRFDFYYEPHSGAVSYYITPYTITGMATPVFDRNVWTMKSGDNLTMLATNRLQGSGSERIEDYGSITWTEKMKLGYGMLPCGNKYTVIFDVYDVTRKIVYQDYSDIDVPCMNESPNEDNSYGDEGVNPTPIEYRGFDLRSTFFFLQVLSAVPKPISSYPNL